MEKAVGNTSPKTKPTVGTILIGHSMGLVLPSSFLPHHSTGCFS